MRRLFAFCLLTFLAGLLSVAQQTTREVARPANPAEDSRPNSDKVPDVEAIRGQFQRVVILRFKYNSDLLAGLEKSVKEQRIKNGVILAGMGSVRGYQVHAVSNRTFPSKDLFVRDPTQPADVIGMNGYVLNGRIHAHLTLSTGDRAFGGHLEPGTNVFTFVIVTLAQFNDKADFSRLDDQTYR